MSEKAKLRIKIRLDGGGGEAKLLRFAQETDFGILRRMIAAKLGVLEEEEEEAAAAAHHQQHSSLPASSSSQLRSASKNDSDDEKSSTSEQCLSPPFRLFLGGDVLVEDTSEIDDGDELVLKKEVPVDDDHGDGDAITMMKKKKNENHPDATTVKPVVEPEQYTGVRVAKWFRVEMDGRGTEKVQQQLFFGRVTGHSGDGGGHESNKGEPQISWEIQYDDGDMENMGYGQLQRCIRCAKANAELDGGDKMHATTSSPIHQDEEDDDSSVEDVTDQILKQRDVVEIDDSGSDYGNVSSEEDDDEDYESDADEVQSLDDASDADDTSKAEKKRKAVASPRGKQNKKRAKKPKEPPLEVLMDNRDVPVAPGKCLDGTDDGNMDNSDSMKESSILSSSGGDADQAIKTRIIKLLNTGFHDNSNEHEAKNAMKLAQRLMRKHNLSQAVLLQERDAANAGKANGGEEILKGGLVEVTIINRKTRKPSQYARWINYLTEPVCENFDVECFHQVWRGCRCSVSFYGIYTNCQLAAYAFRVAVERISQMAAEYKPVNNSSSVYPWEKVTTKSSRLSYALGIVRGIEQEVDATLQREKQRQQRKLARARLAAAKGEAYEESDDDDDDYDNDGSGYSFSATATGKSRGKGSMKDKNSSEDEKSSDDNNDDDDRKPAAKPKKDKGLSLSGDALRHRLNELEQAEQSALVLVDHREKVAKEVLEERGIKLSKGRKEKPITFDRKSYYQGIVDSKEIDINQRAIRDEVKVKKEKKE